LGRQQRRRLLQQSQPTPLSGGTCGGGKGKKDRYQGRREDEEGKKDRYRSRREDEEARLTEVVGRWREIGIVI